MSGRARVGVIASLMVFAACGGKLAPEPIPYDGPQYGQVGDDDDDDDDMPAPKPARPDPPPRPTGDPGLEPVVTDLESKEAAALCADRAAALQRRRLGTFEVESGWTELLTTTGVEATFEEGGTSTGPAPPVTKRYLELTFPMPSTIDARSSLMEEQSFRLEWPGVDEPSDLYAAGSTHELVLYNASWTTSCSSNGLSHQRFFNDYPLPRVTLTVTARSETLLEGTLERKRGAYVERLSFEAQIVSQYVDWEGESQTACCLGRY
ncbi:MAG: hypothetical protein U0270_21555 [Labilithrix sp.]